MRYGPTDGCKRPSDDNGVGPSTKNPKMQILADAIINDTLVHNKRPVEDALHNTALPSPQPDEIFRKLLSSPPGEVFQKLSSPPRPDEVFRKLPSPSQEVVDDVFKLPRTKKRSCW